MALTKVLYTINGVERMLHVDKKKETLADVLRRYGMTGVKVGCGIGQCGACTVLVNGEPVRSCVKKIDKIAEHSVIETIEGVGTAANLHPLQEALIYTGAVQCGFCTPGFIMSAKALLERNANPTRQEVRDWFTKNKNLCRCTGYRPIVDAVMLAAAVMRGEKPIESIRYSEDDTKVLGTSHPRPSALGRVLGVIDYGDDMGLKMPAGTAHLAIVQAYQFGAHNGKLIKLDFSDAEKMPGVYKVITADDVKGTNNLAVPIVHMRKKIDIVHRTLLVKDRIRRAGEVLCIVAADSREHAREAAKLVKAEIEIWKPAMNLLEALDPDAIPVQDGTPNECVQAPVLKGEDTAEIFKTAPHVVEGSFYSSREPHLSIEPQTLQAYVDDEGVLTICWKSQSLHTQMAPLCAALGIPADKLRQILNPCGGSFGYTMATDAPGLVGVAALALERPVTLTMSYAEHQLFTGKRAPSYTNARIACDDNGKLLAVEFDCAVEHGAYSDSFGMLEDKVIRFACYGMNVPNAKGLARAVFSNNSFGVAYRGYGSPQMYTASDQLVDMMARKLGIDPLEFRYRNAIKPGDLTLNSRPYHHYGVASMLEKIRPYYEESRAWKAEGSTDGKLRGVGVTLGGYHVSAHADKCEVIYELNPDGTVTDYNCWQDLGQCADIGAISFAHESLKPLGLRYDQIKLVQSDTGITPFHGPSAGSRSHFVSGHAHMEAAKVMLEAMRKEDGTYRTYDEMVAEGLPTRFHGVWTSPMLEAHSPDTGEGDASQDHNFIVLVSRVEVDPNTGATEVKAVRAVADVGVVGNYLSVTGQAEGGLEHGIGFALAENYSDFEKKTQTLIGCGFLQCNQMPDDIQYEYQESYRENGPFGGGGASECFQSCAHTSVLNAIADATDCRIYEIPATPDKVLAAMKAKASGKELKPAKYDFGTTLEEALDHIKANPVAGTGEMVRGDH